MNIDLSDEAVEYGRLARQALEAAGADGLVHAAERDPDRRHALVAPVLGELGAWELDPRAGADELEAAAALCRSVGWWGVAYPVAERLCRPADLGADGLVVVDARRPAGPLAHLPRQRWVAVTLDGRVSLATPRPPSSPPRRSMFVADLDIELIDGHEPFGGDGDGYEPLGDIELIDDHEPLGGEGDGHEPLGDIEPIDGHEPLGGDGHRAIDVALGLVLPSWTLLGMLDRALALTRGYVRERQQFGQPLASFQGVQFQLTDAEVERAGVEELAMYALWSIEARRADALDDALALRLAAVEAAETVFRVCHQLHGAIGFCDETTLSWISRYSQPLRRLPLGLSATRAALTRRIGRRGLAGLFDAVAR